MDHLFHCEACRIQFGCATYGDEWQTCAECAHGVWQTEVTACDICGGTDGEAYCTECVDANLAFDPPTSAFVCRDCARELKLDIDDAGEQNDPTDTKHNNDSVHQYKIDKYDSDDKGVDGDDDAYQLLRALGL